MTKNQIIDYIFLRALGKTCTDGHQQSTGTSFDRVTASQCLETAEWMGDAVS